MTQIANLVIDLSANVARLSNDMDAAKRSVSGAMKDISKEVGGVKGRIDALAGAMAASWLVGQAKAAIDFADSLNDMSERTGIAAEKLSSYAYVAQMSGTSLDGLATGLKGLAKSMTDAQAGTGDSAAAFSALGISVTGANGRLKSSDAIMGEVADKFADLEDGPAKAALAMDLFGKSGEELIPLLNGGSKGLADMREEADRLGITLDETTIARSAEFNDMLDKNHMQLQSMAARISSGLLPTMTNLGNAFADTAGDTETMRKAGEVLGAGLKGLVSIGYGVAYVFKQIGSDLGALAAAAYAIKDGDWEQARAVMEARGEDQVRMQEEFASTIGKIWADTPTSPVDAKQDDGGGGKSKSKHVPVYKNKQKKEDEQKKLLEQQQKAEFELAKIAISMDAKRAEKHLKVKDALAEVNQALLEQYAALGMTKAEQDRFNFSQDLERKGILQTSHEYKGLMESYDLVQEKQRDWAVGGQQAIDEYADNASNAAKNMAMVFTNAFSGLEDTLTNFVMTGKLQFKDFARSVISDLTRIMIRQQIVAPLAGAFKLHANGGAYGYAGEVSAFADGGAFTNGIYSQPTPFAFAKGGGFGLGVMGEAGPEAIMPLKRDSSGRLGVVAQGGASGGAVTVNVTVNAESGQSSVSGSGSGAELGRMIGSKVRDVIVQEKRPGGLLAG